MSVCFDLVVPVAMPVLVFMSNVNGMLPHHSLRGVSGFTHCGLFTDHRAGGPATILPVEHARRIGSQLCHRCTDQHGQGTDAST